MTALSRSPVSRNVRICNTRLDNDGGYWPADDHSIYGAAGSNADGIDHTTYDGVIANNVFGAFES
jgi:hypothetical protein